MNKYVEMWQRKFTIFSLVLLLVFAIILFVSACEPGGYPIIENQRNDDVRIFKLHVREDGTLGEPIDYGIVPARTTKELAGITFVRRSWVYRIEAVDPSGKVVFSHDYNMNDMEKIDWKIIIPP